MGKNFPEHWVFDRIDNILYLVPTGVYEYEGKKKYYSTGGIQKDFYLEEGVFSFNERPSRANRIAKRNDVFQARMKNTNKPIIINVPTFEGALFSTGFLQLRPYGNTYIEKLIYYYVQSSYFLEQRDELATGSTQEALTDSNAVKLIIPLPPLNEQKRIVEKLDAILPKVKSAKARLEKIPVILKKFRQSVLAAACSGRLTEDWREGKSISNNYLGEKIEEGPYELQDDWLWVELKNISSSFQYGTSSKSEKEGKVPVLRMGNLQNGLIDWSDLKYTNDDSEIKKYALSYGDVLFNRTNSPDLVGKTSIYKEKRTAIFAGYLIRINYKPEYINSDYLNYCLNTERAKEWCKQVKTDGVSQSNINAQVLSTFLIPLPPLEEQQEIVRRVEKLFALADSIEAKYKKALERVEKLEQSILAKAFRGELVEPDPNDEPAEELLKRILEEKVKIEGGKKTRKPKVRKK
ncbi:MAG TPA: restriction endonuclease subunit S [Spirochaetales bacterium]|nr:restriction endonuclease subunit S [Spirochaetales bacterium]